MCRDEPVLRSVAKARNPSLEESTPRPSAARQAEGQHKRGDAVG